MIPLVSEYFHRLANVVGRFRQVRRIRGEEHRAKSLEIEEGVNVELEIPLRLGEVMGKTMEGGSRDRQTVAHDSM